MQKGRLMNKFDTGDIVVGRKQVKSSRKDGIAQKLVFKERDHTES